MLDMKIDDLYEELPICSGFEAILNIKLDFENNKETGFNFSEGYVCDSDFQKVHDLMTDMTRAFISHMKEEWLITHPDFYLSAKFDYAGVKDVCRSWNHDRC